MPWTNSRPGGNKTAAKYRDPAYLATGKRLRAELQRTGQGTCAERVCVMPTRLITPAMRLHLCHDETGQHIRGLGHAKCNLSDAGRRARARQNVSRLRW